MINGVVFLLAAIDEQINLTFLYLMEIILGIIVIVAAVLLYQNPARKTRCGIIILVFSIISYFFGGGFFIGFILGIIGGAFALIWKPHVRVKGTRICIECGTEVNVDDEFCENCGSRPE